MLVIADVIMSKRLNVKNYVEPMSCIFILFSHFFVTIGFVTEQEVNNHQHLWTTTEKKSDLFAIIN